MSISNTCLFEVLRFAPRISCDCNGNVATSGRPVFFCNLYCDFFAVEFSNYAKFHGTVLGCNSSKLAFWLNIWNPLILLRISERWEHLPDWRIFPAKASNVGLRKAWESQTEMKTNYATKNATSCCGFCWIFEFFATKTMFFFVEFPKASGQRFVDVPVSS